MKRAALILLGFLFAAYPGSQAYALKITPFKASVTPGVQGAAQIFRIENNSAEPAAVQVSVLTWQIQPDGTEVNTDAEDMFTVFPAQLVLKPHESKAVRVQWLGDPVVNAEKSYRLVAEQVAVSLMDTPAIGSAVRFLLKFRAALYVTPPAGRSDVIVREVMTGADTLRVTIENRGTLHAILNNPVLRMMLQDKASAVLSGAALAGMAGQNLHAGAVRHFNLPRPAVVTSQVSDANLTFEHGF